MLTTFKTSFKTALTTAINSNPVLNPYLDATKQANKHGIPYDESQNFLLFEAKYKLQRMFIKESNQEWSFYDTGPSGQTPLVCVPGTTGLACVFFEQILALNLRGYRVISVSIPCVKTLQDFVISLDQFLGHLGITKLHLLGVSLGGFLALCYTSVYPQSVESLVLTNAFCSTDYFRENSSMMVHTLDLMPDFYLKRWITAALPKEKSELSLQTALAVDFIVKCVNTLSREDLLARLQLNMVAHCIDTVNYDQKRITVIDPSDVSTTALPASMRDELYELLKEAKRCNMKLGGDFPYLSNHEEYSMLIQVHLRRNGLAFAEYSNVASTYVKHKRDEFNKKYNQSLSALISDNNKRRDSLKHPMSSLSSAHPEAPHAPMDATLDAGHGRGGSLFPFNVEEANKPDGYNARVKEHNKKLSEMEFKWGLFDHKRLYHNKEKEHLFADENDQKDGVLYESDDSSIDSMDDNPDARNKSKFDKYILSAAHTRSQSRLLQMQLQQQQEQEMEQMRQELETKQDYDEIQPGAAGNADEADDEDEDDVAVTTAKNANKSEHDRGLSLDLIADEADDADDDLVGLDQISPMSNAQAGISGVPANAQLGGKSAGSEASVDTPTIAQMAQEMQSLPDPTGVDPNGDAMAVLGLQNSLSVNAMNNRDQNIDKTDKNIKTIKSNVHLVAGDGSIPNSPNKARAKLGATEAGTPGTTASGASLTQGGLYWDIENYDYYGTEWDPYTYAQSNHTQFYEVNEVQKRQYKRDKTHARQAKDLYWEHKRREAKQLRKQMRKKDPKYIAKQQKKKARQAREQSRAGGGAGAAGARQQRPQGKPSHRGRQDPNSLSISLDNNEDALRSNIAALQDQGRRSPNPAMALKDRVKSGDALVAPHAGGGGGHHRIRSDLNLIVEEKDDEVQTDEDFVSPRIEDNRDLPDARDDSGVSPVSPGSDEFAAAARDEPDAQDAPGLRAGRSSMRRHERVDEDPMQIHERNASKLEEKGAEAGAIGAASLGVEDVEQAHVQSLSTVSLDPRLKELGFTNPHAALKGLYVRPRQDSDARRIPRFRSVRHGQEDSEMLRLASARGDRQEHRITTANVEDLQWFDFNDVGNEEFEEFRPSEIVDANELERAGLSSHGRGGHARKASNLSGRSSGSGYILDKVASSMMLDENEEYDNDEAYAGAGGSSVNSPVKARNYDAKSLHSRTSSVGSPGKTHLRNDSSLSVGPGGALLFQSRDSNSSMMSRGQRRLDSMDSSILSPAGGVQYQRRGMNSRSITGLSNFSSGDFQGVEEFEDNIGDDIF